METGISIEIIKESRVPKYQQIVNSIINDIKIGQLKIDEKIPSINEVSEEYDLSRDTVEKAYNILKKKKIIVSAKGKGYYVAKTEFLSRTNVLFVMNKLSSYKMSIYNAFVNALGPKAHVDLQIYHCDPSIFINIIKEKLGGFDYYVIMPHFKNKDNTYDKISPEVMNVIKEIPTEKLILLDNIIPNYEGPFSAVYQDFKNDLYSILIELTSSIEKYEKLVLVYPDKVIYPYPREILTGFRNFCNVHDYDYEIIDTIYDDMEINKKDLFIVIEENDLVNLIKQTRELELNLGDDVGILSYNHTPLKDLLGISTITTDFQVMGETAAYMVAKNKKDKVKNAFKYIAGKSL